MPERSELRATRRLGGCALLCAGLLAVGEVAQHGFGMQPCSWCVLQRLIYLLIGVCFGVGAFSRAKPLRLTAALSGALLSLIGFGVALYLHFVASRSESCLLTLADRILMALSLPDLLPSVFMPTAPCNQANLPLFGLPFALWSAAAFAGLAAGALWCVRALQARRMMFV